MNDQSTFDVRIGEHVIALAFSTSPSPIATGELVWPVGTIVVHVNAATPESVREAVERSHALQTDLAAFCRAMTDAVVNGLGDGVPSTTELEEAAEDLRVELLEINDAGDLEVGLLDLCGNHIPEGYWPVVHVSTDGTVKRVTIDS